MQKLMLNRARNGGGLAAPADMYRKAIPSFSHLGGSSEAFVRPSLIRFLDVTVQQNANSIRKLHIM
eukprot:6486118-Amphidinium_carterae.2